MKKLQALAIALALGVTAVPAAYADSPLSAIQSANSVSINTVMSDSDNILLASNGLAMRRVDLDSLRARIQSNQFIVNQLENFGVSVDDVIGISGDTPGNLTLYVRG